MHFISKIDSRAWKVALYTSVATAGLAFGSVSAAQAQVPSSAEPGLIERRFDHEPRPMATPDKVEGLDKNAVQTPREASGKTFELRSVDVDGVTVYPKDQFDSVFRDRIGQKVSVGDVQAMAAEITRQYREDGYVLTQAVVPQQNIKGGNVRIQVYEGFISNVIVDGDNPDKRGIVQGYGERIMADKPLRLKTLERYLLLADDLPGASAKGVLRPSPNTLGAAELVIVMGHKTLEGSLNANNRGTKFIGRSQFQATVGENSALGWYERTLLRGIEATPLGEDLQFFDIQHEEQIGTDGLRVIGTAGWTNTKPGDVLKVLDIHGRSENYQLEVNKSVIRSRKENLKPRAKFNWRDTENKILGTKLSEDSLRVLRVGTEYDRSDTYNGINLFDVELSQGLDIFGASDDGDLTSRLDGESDFTKIEGTVTRLQSLPRNFSILASLTGQYAFDPLLASEEFSLGGEGFGSAYDPSELTGDHGLAGKVELRWGDAPQKQWLNSYQLYTYYDVGSVWQKDNPVGVDDKQSLASTGLGVRANFVQWLSGTTEVAFPLTRDVAAEGDDDTRFFFSVTGRF